MTAGDERPTRGSIVAAEPSHGGPTWVGITAKAAVVGWAWGYVVVFLWSTHTLIAPLFGYYGYVPRFASVTETLLVVEATFVVALTLPSQCRRPSEVGQIFLAATVAVPVLWMPLLYGPLDAAQVCRLAMSTSAAFCLIWICLRGTRRRPGMLALRRASYLSILAGSFFVALAYLTATGVSPEVVDFGDVYAQRERYKQGIGTLGAYLVGWLSGGLFPVMLAVGLYRRNKTMLALGVAGVLFLFAISGQKSYIIGVPILVGTYVMTRRGVTRTWHWLALLALVVALAAFLDRLRDGYEITSLLVRRAISTAGINTAYYVDMFDGGPLYELRHSVFSMLGPPPYDAPPAIMVGATYYTDGTVANANFLADGFANFGWLGVLGSGVVVGVVLRVYDRAAADLPLGISAPALVFVLQAVANTAVLTTIASHGGAVLIGLVALMPASVAATRWDERRRSAPSGQAGTAETESARSHMSDIAP